MLTFIAALSLLFVLSMATKKLSELNRFFFYGFDLCNESRYSTSLKYFLASLLRHERLAVVYAYFIQMRKEY